MRDWKPTTRSVKPVESSFGSVRGSSYAGRRTYSAAQLTTCASTEITSLSPDRGQVPEFGLASTSFMAGTAIRAMSSKRSAK